MARPVIAVLTDFGLRDHYVAAMKGVMLGICPDATIVDITHEIPPQDVLAGALELEAVIDWLPPGAVVLAVVDPGVGSARRALAIAAGERVLVGPDNGLCSLAARRSPVVRTVSLTEARFFGRRMSRTFEGRDRFAPAAAWVAAGTPLSELGPAVADAVELDRPVPSVTEGGLVGIVLRVDHFGNLVTNITEGDVEALGGRVSIHIGGATLDHMIDTYADAPEGSLSALIGSTGHLEIAVSGGSAAATLAAGRRTPVEMRRVSGA